MNLEKYLTMHLYNPKKRNPADAITEEKADSVLQNMILKNCADFQVEQWLYCLNETIDFHISKMEAV